MKEDNPQQQAPRRNPYLWVPSVYFTQGFPYSFVQEMAQVFLKSLGVANEALGIFQGLLGLPWAFKFLWSPLVELFGTRRRWILIMQTLLSALFVVFAILVFFPHKGREISMHLFMPNPANAWTSVMILGLLFSVAFGLDSQRPAIVRGGFMAFGAADLVYVAMKSSVFFASSSLTLSTYIWMLFACFLAVAFISATHDIAIDGFYLDCLDKTAQSSFSGVRTAAFRAAMGAASGLLVMLAGKTSWGVAFSAGAALFILFLSFHLWYLPFSPVSNVNAAGKGKTFTEAFTSYLDQRRIAFVILFIVLYRIGDFFWKPMAKPFLMDIGVTVAQIGFLQGIIGIIATILGSIAGGIYIAKRGLTRSLWVLGIIQSVTLLLYAYLAVVHKVLPKGETIGLIGLWHVGVINAFENFAYGLGTIAFVNLLMRTCKKEYSAAHYAIATGLMALASASAGFFSGFIQKEIGYLYFFILCFACSIPGLAVLLFLPLKEMEAQQS